MELRVLQYFLMVTREENITRAAEQLHISQPSLSRQLMQLEAELGVKLFKRSNHSIQLTDEGMLLKRRAQELVSLAEKTVKDFACDEGALSGEISIGCGEALSMRFLAETLAAFREENPRVRYSVFSGSADDIKDRLDKGLLDLGLLMEPVDIGKYGFLSLPDKETWGVLARANSPLAGKAAVTPEDLAGGPLLMTGRPIVRNTIANWFGALYERLDIVASFNLLYNAAILAKSGMGTVLCLKLDCDYDGLRFIPLSPKLETGSVLVWKKNQTTAPATEALLRFTRNALKE